MHWIIRFFVDHKNITSLTAVVIACLLMLSASESRQQSIERTLVHTVFYPFQFYFNQTTRIKNVFNENRTLKEQVAVLSLRVAQEPELFRENQRLTALLGISQQYPYTLVPARVVVRDPSTISRSAVINVGHDQGIVTYMPVITSLGVAGKVVQVMSRMSLVQLLIDPANRTSILVQRSRECGILETDNGNDFFIMFRSHADVNVGDTIVTSGFGGIYPRGLMAGIVVKLTENRDPIFKKAIVVPKVQFDRMEEIFVVKLPPQWSSFRQELDSMETTVKPPSQ